jgi:hypothetical protein
VGQQKNEGTIGLLGVPNSPTTDEFYKEFINGVRLRILPIFID